MKHDSPKVKHFKRNFAHNTDIIMWVNHKCFQSNYNHIEHILLKCSFFPYPESFVPLCSRTSNLHHRYPSLTFKPLNNWNVTMASRRHTTEIIQPMYVMICRATWWEGGRYVAWTSTSTAKLVKWSHWQVVCVWFVISTWQPSSDHALQKYNKHVTLLHNTYI
jgi:hypothetical protein